MLVKKKVIFIFIIISLVLLLNACNENTLTISNWKW